MSIIDFTIDKAQQGFSVRSRSGVDKDGNDHGVQSSHLSAAPSDYHPSEETLLVRSQIIQHFNLGFQTMNRPRREFNDLNVLNRMMIDQMSWNVYQPNNGQPLEGDIISAWRSNAMRPTVRNKAISVAAHATARLVFPKIFAHNELSEEQKEAAIVMEDLMEYSAEQSNYSQLSLYAVISALVNPASVVFSEYAEVYRDSKTEKDENGKWKVEKILDEDLSGFQDQVVPIDELFIENFYEHDIQKQGWLIWRKVQSYSLLKRKYENLYENFKYVRRGIQLIFNDANQSFYEVYDPNLRGELCEEIIYWNKASDVKIILVNGVMLTDHDNPNPRLDKQYPFSKFGFELFDEGKCFYYKSLAFKLQQDATIINSLYQMIIDGTYLNLMPPMINVGGEAITSDVIVPGAVTTLSSPDADLRAVKLSENLQAGMNTLFKVDESINNSSDAGLIPRPGVHETAYSMSVREKEAQTQLGPFIKMIESFVKQFGKLRITDILQHLTIVDVSKMMDNNELVYKTFLIPNKNSGGKMKTRKIMLDSELPSEPITEKEELNLSYDVLELQGGTKSETEIYKVNPSVFRNLKYTCFISPDTMNPISSDLERQYNLEEYDRAIQNPLADQEALFKDLLLASYPKTARDVDHFVKKQESGPVDTSNPLEMIKSQMTQNALQNQGQQQPGQMNPMQKALTAQPPK